MEEAETRVGRPSTYNIEAAERSLNEGPCPPTSSMAQTPTARPGSEGDGGNTGAVGGAGAIGSPFGSGRGAGSVAPPTCQIERKQVFSAVHPINKRESWRSELLERHGRTVVRIGRWRTGHDGALYPAGVGIECSADHFDGFAVVLSATKQHLAKRGT